MSFLAISGILNFLTSILLGTLVFSRNPQRPLNQSYFTFNLFIALYSLGYFFWQVSTTPPEAKLWFDLLFTGIVLINAALLFFVFSLLENLGKKRTLLIVHSIISLSFLFLHFRGLIYQQNLTPRYNFGFWPTPLAFFNYYLLYWHWSCFYGFYWLIKGWNTSQGLKKQQVKLVTIACAVGYLGGATNWPMWYGVYFPPYPNITISVYVGLIAYAISRHKLMDFNLIFRWTLAYSILLLCLVSLATPIILINEKISSRYLHLTPGFSFIIAACFLVLVFDPIRKRITRFVDQIIFKSPDFQLLLSGIDSLLSAKLNRLDLCDSISENLKKIFGTHHAGIAIWDYKLSEFSLLPTQAFNNQIITRINEQIRQTDFLIKTLETERRLFWEGIIVEDELTAFGAAASAGERTTFWKIRRTMRWVGGAICVPLMRERNLAGFIILGSKSNASPYNMEDKKFLSHVAEKISTVIQEFVTNDTNNDSSNSVKQSSNMG